MLQLKMQRPSSNDTNLNSNFGVRMRNKMNSTLCWFSVSTTDANVKKLNSEGFMKMQRERRTESTMRFLPLLSINYSIFEIMIFFTVIAIYFSFKIFRRTSQHFSSTRNWSIISFKLLPAVSRSCLPTSDDCSVISSQFFRWACVQLMQLLGNMQGLNLVVDCILSGFKWTWNTRIEIAFHAVYFARYRGHFKSRGRVFLQNWSHSILSMLKLSGRSCKVLPWQAGNKIRWDLPNT